MTDLQSMASMLIDKGVTSHMVSNPDESKVLAMADRAMEDMQKDYSVMLDLCASVLSQRGELSARELSRIAGVSSRSVAWAMKRDDRFTYTKKGRIGRIWRLA